MPSEFSQATSDILAAAGDSATYLHADGQSVALYGLFEDSVDVVDESGQLIERVRALTVDKSALLATVRQGDTVTIGARTYTVQRLLSDDGFAVQVALS